MNITDSKNTRAPHAVPVWAVLSLAVLLAMSAASTDATAAWPTTDWKVTCFGPSVPELTALGDCDDASGTSTAAFTRYQLEDASPWLEAQSFRPPSVDQSENKWLGSVFSGTAVCHFGECYDDVLGLYFSEHFHTDGGAGTLLVSDHTSIAFGDDPDVDNVFSTATHELFHAIQYSYDTFSYGVPDWITEGTAEAVGRQHIGNQLTSGFVPLRSYSEPLHAPSESYDAYRTAGFWMYVARFFDTRGEFGFLHRAFQKNLEGDGLHGIDETFNELGWNGLQNVYLSFVARLAQREQTVFFDECQELIVNAGTDATANDIIKPVAANCFQVTVRGGAEPTGVEIELLADDEAENDLHLIVDGVRQAGGIFIGAVGPGEAQTFLVLIANVAKRAESTVPRAASVRAALYDFSCQPEDVLAVMHPDMEPHWRDMVATKAQMRAENNVTTGEGTLSISGAISAGGRTCVEHVGTNPELHALFAGDSAEVVDTYEQTAAKLQQLLGNIPQDDPMMLLENPELLGDLMSAFSDTGVLAPFGTEGDPLIIMYSPNAMSWATGYVAGAAAVEHNGVAGWPKNATAYLVLRINDTPVDGLVKGETYSVTAATFVSGGNAGGTGTAYLDDDADAPMYGDWEGETAYVQVEGDNIPPGVAADVQDALAGLLSSDLIDRTVAGMRPRFQGIRRNLMPQIGTLSGTVTITKVGAILSGEFSVAGTGRFVEERSEFTYDGEGRLSGDQIVDRQEQTMPIVANGTFLAPCMLQMTWRGNGPVAHLKKCSTPDPEAGEGQRRGDPGQEDDFTLDRRDTTWPFGPTPPPGSPPTGTTGPLTGDGPARSGPSGESNDELTGDGGTGPGDAFGSNLNEGTSVSGDASGGASHGWATDDGAQIQVLAEGLNKPGGVLPTRDGTGWIVVDEAEGGRLLLVTPDGGKTVIATNLFPGGAGDLGFPAGGLIADGDDYIVAAGDGLTRVSLSGTVQQVADARQATNLFVFDVAPAEGGYVVGGPAGIGFISRDGQAHTIADPGALMSMESAAPWGLIVQDDRIIFGAYVFAFPPGELVGRLFSLSLNGSHLRVLAEDIGDARGIAIDHTVTPTADGLAGHSSTDTPGFVVADYTGRLLRVTPQGEVEVIAEGLGRPWGVAVIPEGYLVTDTEHGRLLFVRRR